MKQIKPRVNIKYTPNSRSALDHPIVGNDLNFLKFLHAHCGAVITDELVVKAILNSHVTKSFAIADIIAPNLSIYRLGLHNIDPGQSRQGNKPTLRLKTLALRKGCLIRAAKQMRKNIHPLFI